MIFISEKYKLMLDIDKVTHFQMCGCDNEFYEGKPFRDAWIVLSGNGFNIRCSAEEMNLIWKLIKDRGMK